jgi:5'-deoxynucleotidase YfbR-like HD superfamily hydrolase|tara:strand:+ start:152 stop:691 length:540 start_codon:yes stop_codon:yes gene_type:complete
MIKEDSGISLESYLLMRKLHKRLQGGHVSRYHTRPEVGNNQDVASHSWRALVILTTLWPDISKEAILWVIYHDVAEAELGDLPATTKWNYPEIATLYKKAEQKYEKRLDLPLNENLTKSDQRKIKISDMLELVFHCKRQTQMGNTLALPIYLRGIDYLKDNFEKFPEYKVVESLLNELC